MEQVSPTVIPEQLWHRIQTMGWAVEQLGQLTLAVRCGAPEQIQDAFGRIEGSWEQLVETLEAWVGPTDIAGVERWFDGEAEAEDVDTDPETLRTRIARDTARADALTALLKWREAHPDVEK